jgi:hypothetical protein
VETREPGCPFQAQMMCSQSRMTDLHRNGNGQTRPLDRPPLCGLLKDLVAAKQGFRAGGFAPRQASASVGF